MADWVQGTKEQPTAHVLATKAESRKENEGKKLELSSKQERWPTSTLILSNQQKDQEKI